ncbi:MAG TPA: BamA/TamA family outer membrane protein [Thermomonas sp.]|nr:BamA/TamA family outer membrane protein [Thermomonas sp.]
MSDGKDSFLFPTTGWYQKASLEVAVPGGDLTFYKASYQLQRYFAMSRAFTLMLNGEVGYANSYGDTVALPFYKNFYAGGVNTVRGFKAGSLGPQDIYGNALGGNERFIGQAIEGVGQPVQQLPPAAPAFRRHVIHQDVRRVEITHRLDRDHLVAAQAVGHQVAGTGEQECFGLGWQSFCRRFIHPCIQLLA